jgi:PAT family beta-lactamase induction signal transducer AmpG
MGIPRVFAAASTGILVEFAGWESFFIFCTMMAIPGLVLLKTMVKKINPH